MTLRECKIKCENWWWNRALQMTLSEIFGVSWGAGAPMPFNTRRRGEYLFLQQNKANGRWFFSWGTDWDFERCELPATTAKTMMQELSA